MSNTVRWFEIYVADMSRAKKFYETVFGHSLQPLGPASAEMEMWAFPADQAQYGCGGALVKMAGIVPGGIGTIVYFGCADCAVEEQKALAAGARLHKSKFSIGEYGHISLVYDTEGNMIGLHSM